MFKKKEKVSVPEVLAYTSCVKSPKANLEGYRALQKTVRTIKDNLASSEKDLLEYKKDLMKEFEEISVDVRGVFTIVQLAYANEEAVGISKRSVTDSPNSTRGYQIAKGRAEKALIQKINNDKFTQTEILAG